MTRYGLCLCVLLGVSGSALADPIQFTGPYAPANWTLTLSNSDGSVNTAGAPNSITIRGSDNQDPFEDAGNTDFTIRIPANGTVSFNWAYETEDEAAEFDPFGYLLNGAFFPLADEVDLTAKSGTTSVAVKAGDLFGFRARSEDNLFGRSTTVISNFDAPVAALPEPTPLVVFGGVALVSGLSFTRRRRATTT